MKSPLQQGHRKTIGQWSIDTLRNGELHEVPNFAPPTPATYSVQDIESLVARSLKRLNGANGKLSYSQQEADKFMRDIESSPFSDAIESIVIDRNFQLSLIPMT